LENARSDKSRRSGALALRARTSASDHWQTYWERERKHTCRVEQENWETPRQADWIERIRAAVRSAPGPVVLAAHSLGCATVAHLAREATPSELAKIIAPTGNLGDRLLSCIPIDDPWMLLHRLDQAQQFAESAEHVGRNVIDRPLQIGPGGDEQLQIGHA